LQLRAETIANRVALSSSNHLSINMHGRIRKSKCRPHRSEDLSECIRKNIIGNITAEYHRVIVLPSMRCIPRLQPHPNTRSCRARNSVLEIYLRFIEAPSYPRYFLRNHKLKPSRDCLLVSHCSPNSRPP